MQPGDTYMGLDLRAGGHLTHGAPVNQSGKWFNVVSYGVSQGDNLIDYDWVEKLARENKPKLILARGSAYPRVIRFQRSMTEALSLLAAIQSKATILSRSSAVSGC